MQNKKFVGSTTSCKCLFAEQTLCRKGHGKVRVVLLPGCARRRWGRKKLPPSFCLCPQYTQSPAPESLQGCTLNNHHFSCLLHSVVLCSFHQEEVKVLLAGMSHYWEGGLGKIYHWLKSCRGKANLSHHSFSICLDSHTKVCKSSCYSAASSLSPPCQNPCWNLISITLVALFSFWPLLSILPNSRHYRMRKYWE